MTPYVTSLRALPSDLTLVQLQAIPTIGPSAPLISYLGAIRYVIDLEGMVREGYKKVHSSRIFSFDCFTSPLVQYYGIIFKVSMLDGWLVIFTGPKLIDELRRSPDDELSSVEGTAEVRPNSVLASTFFPREPHIRTRTVYDVVSMKLTTWDPYIGLAAQAHARPRRRRPIPCCRRAR